MPSPYESNIWNVNVLPLTSWTLHVQRALGLHWLPTRCVKVMVLPGGRVPQS